jgi:hypothetical protein
VREDGTLTNETDIITVKGGYDAMRIFHETVSLRLGKTDDRAVDKTLFSMHPLVTALRKRPPMGSSELQAKPCFRQLVVKTGNADSSRFCIRDY